MAVHIGSADGNSAQSERGNRVAGFISYLKAVRSLLLAGKSHGQRWRMTINRYLRSYKLCGRHHECEHRDE